jgi:acyl-ACP thioesterase
MFDSAQTRIKEVMKLNHKFLFEVREDEQIGKRLEHIHRLAEMASFSHAQALGVGDDIIRPLGKMWLVVKVSTKLLKLPIFMSEIHIQTTPLFGLASGVLWIVEATCNNQLVFEQAILWAMADQTSQKAIRLPEFFGQFEQQKALVKDKLKDWFSLDASMIIPTHCSNPQAIHPSHIDFNHHLHNTRYIEYLFVSFPVYPREIEIHYLTPILPNDMIIFESCLIHDTILVNGLATCLQQITKSCIARILL